MFQFFWFLMLRWCWVILYHVDVCWKAHEDLNPCLPLFHLGGLLTQHTLSPSKGSLVVVFNPRQTNVPPLDALTIMKVCESNHSLWFTSETIYCDHYWIISHLHTTETLFTAGGYKDVESLCLSLITTRGKLHIILIYIVCKGMESLTNTRTGTRSS